MFVVAVVGPQSSGKSTLMNYTFGTQFFTSVGRCTKGIYFTIQKMLSDDGKEQWLLLLDSEGILSSEKSVDLKNDYNTETEFD